VQVLLTETSEAMPNLESNVMANDVDKQGDVAAAKVGLLHGHLS
jgi:hypothetical protein